MKVCRLCRHYAPGAKERCPRDGGELVEGPVPPVAPGDTVGEHTVGRALAAGQSGVLLKVRGADEAGDAGRLLKVLNPSIDPVDARRPVLETVQGLEVQGLLPIREILEAGDRICLLQDEIPGVSLAVKLKLEGALSPEETVALGLRLCAILGEVHRAGLQHHDVRPGHLLIPKGKPLNEALLLDLGSPSPPGSMAAPELHQGRGGVVETDVYGLCMTLFVALAGRSPFRADAPEELAWMIRSSPPPPLRVVRQDRSIEPALEQVIMWGLSKDSRDRPSLDKLANLLGALAEGDHDRAAAELEGAPTTALPARPEPPPKPASPDEPLPDLEAVAAALREKSQLADGENPTMRIVRKIVPQSILKPTGLTQSFFVEGDQMEQEIARFEFEEAQARRENMAVWMRFLSLLILAAALVTVTIWALTR